MASINKNDMIIKIAESTKLSQKDVKNVLDIFFEEVKANVVAGSRVSLHGFGAFSTKIRQARLGKSPIDKKEISIPESIVIRFTPVKEFKYAVSPKEYAKPVKK